MPVRPKRGWGRFVVAMFFFAILVGLFFVPGVRPLILDSKDDLRHDLVREPPKIFPKSAEYTFTRQIQLSISGGEDFVYTIRVPRPQTIAEQQEVSPPIVSGDPQVTSTGFYRWEETVQGDGVVLIEVRYHLTAFTHRWEINEQSSGSIADIPAAYKRDYLGDKWKIQPSDSDLATLARQITGGTDNVYLALFLIFDWMQHGPEPIFYEKQRSWEPQDPQQTLLGRSGDCDDQTILYASLARSLGIPVWLEMGALFDQSQNAWGGHAWGRAFIPLKDGTGQVVNIDLANSQFLVRDPYRLTEWVEEGNATALEQYYKYASFSYQSVGNIGSSQAFISQQFEPSKEQVVVTNAGQDAKVFRYLTPGFEVVTALTAVLLVVLVSRRRRTGG